MLEVTTPESMGNPIHEAATGWVVETETVPTEGQDTEPRTSIVRWTGGCGPDLEQAWTGADEAFPIPTVVLAERLSV